MKNHSTLFKHKKGLSLWYFPLVISLGIIFTFLILWGSKTALGIIATILLFLFFTSLIFKIGFEKINKYVLYIIIFTIPFPYLVQFLGKDALTVTTLMIYFLFMTMVLNHLFERKGAILEPRFAFILPILIFISLTISLILNPIFIGQSIRYYVANVSGILLYFIILASIKRRLDVILIIKVVLFTLILQSGIAFLQWKFPVVAKYLIPFGTRVAIPQASIVEGLPRVTGTVLDYELLAGWFLIGSILSISLIYELRRSIYIFPLFCCIAGIIFTATRSDLLLLAFGLGVIFILLVLFKKDYRKTSIKIILYLVLGNIILFALFPQQIGNFIQRLEIYFHHSRLLTPEAINRKEVWERALHIFLKKPTIFGKGLYNVGSLYYWAGSFHSLYLTILYKIGIFGLVIYILFWLKMLQKAWYTLVNEKKCRNWYIVFFLFIAVILMLIDGIKVEYLRRGHFIQFAWMIYALLLVSLRRQSKKNYENTMVSQTPI